MKQEDCVLSLIRSGGEIKTKVSHRQHDFEPPGSKEVPNWNELYQIISVPVEEVKQSLVIKQFYAAWHRLENVDQWDAATLVDVLVVLTESVAALDSPDIPIRLMETEPASPKPTAAHPRAFRGTKYKPPKSKRPASYNLQTALGTLKNQVIVLQKLWVYRDKAIKPLCDLGYESARVESLLALSTPPIDPSLFLRHPDTPIEVKPQQFPNTFREDILPVLRGFHWNDVEMALKLFWMLELHEQSQQRAAVSRLLVLSSTPSVLDWLQHIANQSREHQFILLVCAIELNVARSSCPIGIEQVLSALHEFASVERYPQWAYAMLGGLRDGICVNYLREGIRLAGEFSPAHCFYLGKSCDDFKSSVVANVLFQLPKELEDWSIKDKAMSIWKAAAQLDEFFKIFTATDWLTLSPKQVDNYLTLLLAFLRYDDDEAVKWQAKWRIFKKYHVQTETCLRLIPDAYVKQWVDDFMDFIYPEMDNTLLAQIIEDAITLAKRLAQPPFLTESNRELVFGHLIRIPHANLRQRVLNTPEKSLKCLDKACRRDNNAKLIAWGLSSIVNQPATFAVDCLWYSPKKLAKTAKLLGTMSWELRLEIMREFAHHPIMMTDFDALPLPKVYETIQTLEAIHRCNPIPKALREYFAGKRTLREGQLERHRQVLLSNLLKTKLQVLEDIGKNALWRGFEAAIEIPEAKHALQLFRGLFSNKRVFRRFLKAYVAGNLDYFYRHPLTIAWLKRHPKIDLALWTRGILFEDFADKTYISITLEQAPLEVLKLGTYVGSCLGVGGIMTDSAVAAMVDVNKQVLYARNENGTVLARQLIAIAKNDQLVAFEVYPINTSSRLKALFRSYDQHFANRLGITLFNDNDHTKKYDIEHILSEHWWDDGAWYFDTN